MTIECFFYIEPDLDNKDDGIIRALCIECKKKQPKDFPCWFYSGQVGPWNVKCHKCGKVIHLHEDDNEAGGKEAPTPV